MRHEVEEVEGERGVETPRTNKPSILLHHALVSSCSETALVQEDAGTCFDAYWRFE